MKKKNKNPFETIISECVHNMNCILESHRFHVHVETHSAEEKNS